MWKLMTRAFQWCITIYSQKWQQRQQLAETIKFQKEVSYTSQKYMTRIVISVWTDVNVMWMDGDVGCSSRSKFSSPNQHPAQTHPPLILPSSLVVCLPSPGSRPKSDLMDSKLQWPEILPHLNLEVSQTSAFFRISRCYSIPIFSSSITCFSQCTCLCLAIQGSPGCRWVGVGWVGAHRGGRRSMIAGTGCWSLGL